MITHLIFALAANCFASAVLPPVTDGLVAFWSFQEAPYVDAVNGYVLKQTVGPPVNRTVGPGAFGPYAVRFVGGQRLAAPRASVPAIAAIHGPAAQVSLVAWVATGDLTSGGYVGGCWQENKAWRQFALFVHGTAGCQPADGMVAHISGAGSPEDGHKYCESAACGPQHLPVGDWDCLANVYNGTHIMAYVNGTLAPGDRNPLQYPSPSFPVGGIFSPPAGGGADFAIGANLIHPGGGVGPAALGNHFVGEMAGFGVFDRALSPQEVHTVCHA